MQVQGILNQRCGLLTSVLLLNANSPLPLSRAEKDLEAEVEAMAAELSESKRQVHAVVAQAKQATRPGAKGPVAQGNIHQARDMIRKSTTEVEEVRSLQDELHARLELVSTQ